LPIEVFEAVDRNMGCNAWISGNRHRVIACRCISFIVFIIAILWDGAIEAPRSRIGVEVRLKNVASAVYNVKIPVREFMGMSTQPATTEHLSPELASIFLEGLPDKIRSALELRAKTMNYPVWAVVEMAIAGYLDDEALSFVDCQPRLD
jgi:hypothetical protein